MRIQRVFPAAVRAAEHPAIRRVHPQCAGEDREEGGRDFPGANAEHEQDAADRLHPEYDVGEEAGQPDLLEELRRAREAE
jgi:hypothetical protein